MRLVRGAQTLHEHAVAFPTRKTGTAGQGKDPRKVRDFYEDRPVTVPGKDQGPDQPRDEKRKE